MHPKDYYTITMLQDWFKAEEDKKHSMAVNYIEENVNLIDTDLQKFLDGCPSSCQLEVYEMLLKAGIDTSDYVISGALKHWENYIHDANQYYTIDYKQKMQEYITDTINWKTEWLDDVMVLNTLGGVVE